MRRQTTNEPNGPATSAMQMPAIKALIMKSAILLLDHAAVDVVLMVVMVGINGKGLGFLLPEQCKIRRIDADLFRATVTADVMIETDHLIRGGHYQVQIVGDHQYTAVVAIANFVDELIKLGLPCYVHTLGRLVQHQ